MKIKEDKEITTKKPNWTTSFRGPENLPTRADFLLIKVEEQHPPKLRLIFKADQIETISWIEPKPGSIIGESRLGNYKKEIEEKLMGKTWDDILRHNFTFLDAHRL